MLFRDHPLLADQNSRSWPPDWLWCAGFDNTHPLGEVGILKTTLLSRVKPASCFLIMDHAGAEYMGELFISDAAFCSEFYEVLLRHCGKTIQEIGDIDLSDTRLFLAPTMTHEEIEQKMRALAMDDVYELASELEKLEKLEKQ
jgi:hypothetical protein